ncbi:hypothetical protein HYV11_02290 [Candidatus Dependentiae bacterium]|nr:hypothetical protein [Candidatus Dependentiae bacterium]
MTNKKIVLVIIGLFIANALQTSDGKRGDLTIPIDCLSKVGQTMQENKLMTAAVCTTVAAGGWFGFTYWSRKRTLQNKESRLAETVGVGQARRGQLNVVEHLPQVVTRENVDGLNPFAIVLACKGDPYSMVMNLQKIGYRFTDDLDVDSLDMLHLCDQHGGGLTEEDASKVLLALQNDRHLSNAEIKQMFSFSGSKVDAHLVGRENAVRLSVESIIRQNARQARAMLTALQNAGYTQNEVPLWMLHSREYGDLSNEDEVKVLHLRLPE